jgi:hypothetical protein
MSYWKKYRKEVAEAGRNAGASVAVLTDEDIRHLPPAVRRYLNFAGCMGKPRVSSAFIVARGVMYSSPQDKGMKFRSEQHNFYPDYSRFFYIRALKAGIPAMGLHVYKGRKASMEISVAGLFKVVDARGPEMDQGETVTVFNDMCFMAPATLIDPNIRWEEIDSLNVRAFFTNGDLKISAVLTFAEDGRLVDFLSRDRFETSDGKVYKNYPWRTPVLEYRESNGLMLPYRADVIYVRPEGEFCYGKFELIRVLHNV